MDSIELPNLTATKVKTEPLIWNHSWVISQLATWWQVDYIGPILSWKGQHFVFTRIAIYSVYGFAFPECNISVKATIPWLTECLNPPSWYTAQHCFWWKNSIHSKGSVTVSPYSMNLLVLSYFLPSWSIFLDKRVEWFLKILTVPYRRQCLEDLG